MVFKRKITPITDIIGLDIETTPFSMITPEIHTVGLYSYSGKNAIYFDNAKDTNRFLFFKPSFQSGDLIVMVHNAKFDLNLLFNELVLPLNWKFDIVNINGNLPRFIIVKHIRKYRILNRKTSKIEIRQKITTIYFIDLMNFVPYKLATLMELYTPNLLKFKFTGDFGLERNYGDIKATAIIYAENFCKIRTIRKKLFPFLSISSIAFNDLLERSNYKWEYRINKETGKAYHTRPFWLIVIEKNSYQGGIVYPNPKFINQKIDNAKYYDINSMYSYIMKYLKVPYAFESTNTLPIKTFKQTKRYIITSYNIKTTHKLFYLNFIALEPILISKIDGKNELPVNIACSGWYNENELYYAVKGRLKFKQLVLLKEIVYKANYMQFSPFVDYWFNIKRNSTNEVERDIAKKYLNHAYGKYAQNMYETIMIEETNPLFHLFIRDRPDHYLDHETGTDYFVRYELNAIFLDTIDKTKESKKSVTIVSSAITGGARGYLMANLNPNKTIYADTDSLVQVENDILLSDELGGWKIEKEGTIIVYGKKWYEFDGELKCKGVPKKAIESKKHTFTYYRLIGYRESKRRKLPLLTTIKVEKVLDRNLDF